MKKYLDLSTWNRKDHFGFFNRFEEPFFGLTVQVDCTSAYHFAKDTKCSFFLVYLHKALAAANQVEPFKFRVENDQVVIYDVVHASPTINRPDGTFGFSYIDFHEDFSGFLVHAQAEVARVHNSTGLVPASSGENVIHFSSIPWINFTSLSHARAFAFKDSIPKISFGKMTVENGKRTMPVSIHAHHGLMDGQHVGQFIDRFQHLMSNPGQMKDGGLNRQH